MITQNPKLSDCKEPWSAGAELWILPDSQHSTWARKVDWYLNFQMMRAEPHVPRPMAAELAALEEKWVDEPWSLQKNLGQYELTPLLVAPSGRLPCRQTVMIRFSGRREDLSSWLAESLRVSRGFLCPVIRVFLPDGVSQTDACALWLSVSTNDDKVRAPAGVKGVERSIEFVEWLRGKAEVQ